MKTRSIPFLFAVVVLLAGCDADSPIDPTPGPVDVTLMPVGTGSVRSDGIVSIEPDVGDSAMNRAYQAFLRYDLSGIPSDATVDAVSVNFTDHTVAGDPFEWGCVSAYAANVFPLQSSAYLGVEPSPNGQLFNWCDAGELAGGALIGDRLLLLAQSAVGAAIDLRLQMSHKTAMGARTDADGDPDQLRFGMPTLTITYTEAEQ